MPDDRTPVPHTSDVPFVPLVLEDELDGTFWIAGNKTAEEAVELARQHDGHYDDFQPVRVWMRCGLWGNEDEWEDCDEQDEGAQPFWRMDVKR